MSNKQTRFYINFFALSAIFLFTHSAYAGKMKCACDAAYAAGLEGKKMEGYTFSCPKNEQSEKGTTNSMSVQETNIKFYIDSATREKSTTASTVQVDFRPRNGKCLDSVADGTTKGLMFVGPYCSTDTYKTVSGITLDKTDSMSAKAPFSAQVTGPKHYAGSILYTYKSDTDKLFAYALCIENK